MVGSIGERMLAATLPYAASWNVWYSTTGNRPDGVPEVRERVDAACRAAGRDPASVEATVAVLVRVQGGGGRLQGSGLDTTTRPLEGSSEEIAQGLRAYADAGVAEVQLVVDPINVESVERLAPVLEILDAG